MGVWIKINRCSSSHDCKPWLKLCSILQSSNEGIGQANTFSKAFIWCQWHQWLLWGHFPAWFQTCINQKSQNYQSSKFLKQGLEFKSWSILWCLTYKEHRLLVVYFTHPGLHNVYVDKAIAFLTCFSRLCLALCWAGMSNKWERSKLLRWTVWC